MISVTQAALFCGGMGTRLRPLTDTLPKPMAPIHRDKPFLHYLLEQLSEQGIRRFVLMTGYLAEVISDYFGDGRQWGWDITYSRGPAGWDTGQRLWEARELLDKRFLLLYSDNFAAFSLASTLPLHEHSKAAITLLIQRKVDGNIALSVDGRIERYDPSRRGEDLDYVELGYMIAEREPVLFALQGIEGAPDVSFAAVLKHLASAGALNGYELQTPYHSISDLDRLCLMRKHLAPKRILLIDRDGTIHSRAGQGEYVLHWEQVQLLPEAVDGLVRLAGEGFKFIVISNQAAIGRGLTTRAAVDDVNAAIRDQFLKIGVEFLAFEICPHSWTEHCSCRKPKPRLFFDAATKFDLRLDRTIYVGDDPRDIEAAETAGSSCLYVGEAAELAGSKFADRRVYLGLNDTVPDILSSYDAWERSDYSVSLLS